MGLNSTPRSERFHIAFFGNRNAGKSSLLNAVSNQDIAVVSERKGTTTDPVYKSMEILPIGPCVLIDTPGLDDEGELGGLRIRKAREVLRKADAAVIVADATSGDYPEDIEKEIKAENIPYIVVFNKEDQLKERKEGLFYVSAKTKEHIEDLRVALSRLKGEEKNEKKLVSDLIPEGSTVVLVIPIDSSAPKGRLILPQQQAIRDILDSGSIAVCTKDTELEKTLSRLSYKADLVITDSQAFRKVSEIVPECIPLTSFSILMARYKGFLDEAVRGVEKIKKLEDKDTILIAEGCTHHRQCEDIGTVKIPNWIRSYTGKDISFEFSSGQGFPENLEKYSLIIHCGACMLNEKEVLSRMREAERRNVAFTNYGTVIAFMNGILSRSLEIMGKVYTDV